MTHIYIDDCTPEGGILHYTLENNKLVFAGKLCLDRPMFTVFGDGKFHTLLRETDRATRFGGVIAGEITDGGGLEVKSNIASTNGICPCHLCVNRGDIFAVNYLSGSITKIGGKTIVHSGHGINKKRQEAAHTHSVIASPDGKYLLSADLGLDTVFVYDFELNEVFKARVPDGSGCRHLAFSENGRYLFCVNELSSDISVFLYNSGNLTYLQTYACALPGNTENTAAAIICKGNKLYVSHRGADCITCFNECDGRLEFVSNTYSGGKSPRDFKIAGNCIITANEGGSIGIISLACGHPEYMESVHCGGNPLCVNVVEL